MELPEVYHSHSRIAVSLLSSVPKCFCMSWCVWCKIVKRTLFSFIFVGVLFCFDTRVSWIARAGFVFSMGPNEKPTIAALPDFEQLLERNNLTKTWMWWRTTIIPALRG